MKKTLQLFALLFSVLAQSKVNIQNNGLPLFYYPEAWNNSDKQTTNLKPTFVPLRSDNIGTFFRWID